MVVHSIGGLMLNGSSAFLIGPLGLGVYLASLALFFQGEPPVSAALPGRATELIIIVLLSMIGVLLRMGYSNVKEQVVTMQKDHREELNAIKALCTELRDKVTRLETLAEKEDA